MSIETTQNIIKSADELSEVTSQNMLELFNDSDFKYTEEIKTAVTEMMKKVMEIEKNITEEKIKNEFNINTDKLSEFNELDSNYRRSMLSRYEVYKNLTTDEIKFIEKYKNSIQALNNISVMYDEAKKYIVAEGIAKSGNIAA